MSYIDGNWIDISSAVTCVAYVAYQKCHQKISWKAVGPYIGTGVGFFPIVILTLSFSSSWLIQALLGANRLTLFIAGLFALVSMLDSNTGMEVSATDTR